MENIMLHGERVDTIKRFAQCMLEWESPNAHVGGQKAMKLILQLILEDPEPLEAYLFGYSRLRRVEIRGSGKRNDPYVAIWADDYYRDC